ncbi:MAG: UDP-N-acetylmuramoyl-tripeptide--D-alanyl-D-alanine ligase [Firmicutes bacterium]|nr:UDP-N-acetylmuramoyl-tripeptide--D-alanyl-D-alanine ligase [Bacillota bacterium]
MNRTTIRNILDATGGTLLVGAEQNYITGIRHDSRECGEGDMFVAIIGENQDGHKYIPGVIGSGCRTFLVSHTDGWFSQIEVFAKASEVNIILVEDTVEAMGKLARWYLGTLNVKKVAVTGSVGKTSVRDMIYYVLNETYHCGRNLKNFNNNIGLPISIFQFDDETEAVVLEMGMSDFGEIRYLSSLVQPQIGVITNIGVAHIEHLGSRDGIFQAKMEIAENLLPETEGGTLVYVRDEEFLNGERTKGDYAEVSVGMDGHSTYIISNIDDFGLAGIEFTLEYRQETRRIKLPLPGTHNALNAGLAIAVGNLLGVSLDAAARGLAKADLTGRRLHKVQGKTRTVIDDTYNANPDSMKSALKVLEKSRCEGRKVAILGDMFELGEDSPKLHYSIGIFARGCGIDRLVAIGERAEEIARGAAGGDVEVYYFKTKEDFYEEMDQITGEGDIVLVKASRGMTMEDVVEKVAEL